MVPVTSDHDPFRLYSTPTYWYATQTTTEPLRCDVCGEAIKSSHGISVDGKTARHDPRCP